MTPRPLPDLAPVPARECCAPLGRTPLREQEAVELASRLRALADPHRLRMLSLLLAEERGEARTADLVAAVGLSQPTVTHHLRQLTAAGLVTAQRRGSESWYVADPGTLSDLAGLLDPARE